MSDCPDCGRPFAKGAREYRRGGACGLELSRTEHNDTNELELSCRTVQVERLKYQLASALARAEALELAARAVVAADTYPMPGKTRFEATSEAIAKLETLLPQLPAMCAASEQFLNPESGAKGEGGGEG